ncbi:hypothetical protein [Pseudomonas fluorescens]|uniref:Type III secretion protein n=1 Tax=Pseudomonas fluorescens TaxID=294 RepID=A0A944DGW5_PSEFL|nr:hypothetical protein [Pseudomonas fluorescens]MBT2298555.1 hypothetical protein [Pseudomonas fluorescens]MBT2310080.1 hypothetical protein [Pseudomonas fluorescens]MBT2311104.1 hypothetical protein [Pseudomonas fluorescens]MBT2319961.1 hypothetical protein [Pseudomonas fluorescens]MBT2329011.1 hypothetical protein [Pseudomonas fluorescens]
MTGWTDLNDEPALRWVDWWARGAKGPVGALAVSETVPEPLRGWLRQHPEERRAGTAMPPPPNLILLPLLALEPEQWSRLFSLVVTVCDGGHRPARPGLGPAELIWCRRLGKALQPGRWLPAITSADATDIQGLRLLRAWVGEVVWQRLRHSFARADVIDAERQPWHGLPGTRLTALWQAAAWHSLTLFAQGSSHVDPSQFDPQPASDAA